ncbi:sortase domain-bontaining protein [Corynebacterium sp. J010B-136]|uniref:sortase domain-containing protein n=1 Tax=Corynebacterium sp. J010B-136 TaxID=2099401 RepID=UPI001E47CE95|nr:sortase [Corynebacterium sp. J010B-136]
MLLLFAFYEAYWTNVESGKLQEQAQEQLDETWQNLRKQLNPKLGEAFARMYIPAFGDDLQFAIVEGTDENDLLHGPGDYEQTQRPGEEGNFGVAGHRVGKGSPFNDLGSRETCDAIVVETKPPEGSTVCCRLRRRRCRGWMFQLGAAGQVAGRIFPRARSAYYGAERMIIHAMEVENLPKTASCNTGNRPAPLEEHP